MKRFLFPRLDKGGAELWAERFGELKPDEIRDNLPDFHIDGVTFTPTGGERVEEAILEEFREDIIEIAEDGGYPNQTDIDARRHFDLEVSRRLLELPIIPGEALRDEVWQYLTCIVIPDAVAWRFGERKSGQVNGPTSERRFLGGTRNLLQRLWWRVRTLRDPGAEDELWLLDTGEEGLTEDNLVALTERSHIAAYRNLSKTIAEQFVFYRRFIDEETDGSTEDLLREVMKRVVRLGAFANLEAIPDDRRVELIGDLFIDTIEAMGGSAPTPGRVYDRVASRHLKPIDLPDANSNQHEVQGVSALREMLGEEPQELTCEWKLYWDDGSVRDEITTRVKWYDAREANPSRSEWRLYYPDDAPMDRTREKDMLVLATSFRDENLHAFILPRGSKIYLQARGVLQSGDGVDIEANLESRLREMFHAKV